MVDEPDVMGGGAGKLPMPDEPKVSGVAQKLIDQVKSANKLHCEIYVFDADEGLKAQADELVRMAYVALSHYIEALETRRTF